MTSQIPLKSDCDITNAVEIFNKCVQSAAWEATPTVHSDNDYIPTYPQIVVDLPMKAVDYYCLALHFWFLILFWWSGIIYHK
ncbi:unnamed protein product [Leptidea sinapis]|uniref:Uncharacterized protein n=1 Tax=Leptidea sinapis TaxID=189913 RepID=A0A5E4QBZ4_9NEOP|nr:unnamed protein product [Leptidea sinapis]